MQADEKTLSALQELGLNRSEARTYVALVARGASSASEIARDAKIPHPRVYDIMESLAAKGLVEIQTGRRQRYTATKPEVAFERLLNSFREKGEFLTKQLTKIYDTRMETPSIWMLKGRNNIVDEISQISHQAENELLLAVPVDLLGVLGKRLRKARKKGVTTSLVVYADENESRIDPEVWRYADLRVREPPGSVIALADYSDCVLCSHKTLFREAPGEEEHAIVAGDLELLQILSYFFYHSLWCAAKPVEKEVSIQEYPRTFVHIWKVIEEVEMLREKGYQVKASVKGKTVKDQSPTEFGGLITEATNINGRIFSVTVKKSDGSKISVGGLGASIEDVEATRITLKPFKK